MFIPKDVNICMRPPTHIYIYMYVYYVYTYIRRAFRLKALCDPVIIIRHTILDRHKYACSIYQLLQVTDVGGVAGGESRDFDNKWNMALWALLEHCWVPLTAHYALS